MPFDADTAPAFAASTFVSLFVAVDPLAAVPVFLVMTENETAEARRVMARRAALAAFSILSAFGLLGPQLLAVLGISLDAFRVAGGLLLFLLALDMVRAQRSRTRTSPEEEAEGTRKDDVSIFPLAIPMLAGPAAVSSVMVLAARATHPIHEAIVGVAVAVTALIAYWMLRSAAWIGKRLGRTGMNVIERVFGLLLAATAVQFVLDGLAASLSVVTR
jgi:multiple antibiotic resistance protein